MKITYDSSWLFAWRTDSFKEVLKAEPTSIKLLGAPIATFSTISIVTILGTGDVYPHTISPETHISLVRFYKYNAYNYAIKVVTKRK
jgi:hypothetical protein